ncbi:MAG TPA: malto-oligosyltrehalose synthase [Thermoanaerobaculia bacterium]|nr:malto-oligosyltrehalose synthase [Thermoanaerobaculia bacterium]
MTVASTYRLQLNRNFRFADARAILDHLQSLGITHLYSSPILRAMPGSLHGYDVVDPLTINPEIGSEEELRALSGELRRRGMGLIIDIVPNHMAARSANGWWMDVLQNGSASPFADFFDVNWEASAVREGLEHRILLPILGRPYGDVLEEQEIRLSLEDGAFYIRYFDRKLPLNLQSYARILRLLIERLQTRAVLSDGDGIQRLEDLTREIEDLAAAERIGVVRPARSRPASGQGRMGREPLDQDLRITPDPGQPAAGRRRDRAGRATHTERTTHATGGTPPRRAAVRGLQKRLATLLETQPAVRAHLRRTLEILNGTKGDPSTFDELDQILEEQPYRLAFWRMAAEEINYRRFFDITDLISIRVNDPRVFEATHAKILELVRDDVIQGLRLDHIDGLYDPEDYLQRLRDAVREQGARDDFLIVMEKILAPDETLPAGFAIRGTTGYEFLARVERLFVDPAGFEELRSFFFAWTGKERRFGAIAHDCKKQVLHELFAGELRNFGERLGRLASHDRRARDIPVSELSAALEELIASLPVYRTYVRDLRVSDPDRRVLEEALDHLSAHGESEDVGAAAAHFLRQVLLLEPSSEVDPDGIRGWLELVMRWQQLTGPVTAKGVEDTALYVYTPLLALNDVGCEPVLHEPPLEAFHRAAARTIEDWPRTLTATSTHDTKRSEDVRARLNVLSEMPGEWARHLRRWRAANRKHRVRRSEPLAPDPAEELFLYQTLIGIWPLERERPGLRKRIRETMTKAMREARAHTRWTAIDERYESDVLRFVDAILDPERSGRFLADLEKLHARVSFYGAINALAQVALKIAAPGIPDFYQGTELWDFSLVDPDNRRPVDFARRAALRKRIPSGSDNAAIEEVLARWRDGRVKMLLTTRGLEARRNDPELFIRGRYQPLEAEGERSRNLIGFARNFENGWLIAAVPRFPVSLTTPERFPLGERVWKRSSIRLPADAPTRWVNRITGETLEAAGGALLAADLFRSFPVALLGAEG